LIYLDYAATAPLRPEARAAMAPFLAELFGNPSSIHAAGQAARAALDAARERVARALGAAPEEVLFTSGGTEADNLALVGTYLAARPERGQIVTAATEHHAVLDTCDFLRTLGASVTVLPVDGCGIVDPERVAAAITPRTALVSVMAANNEIGTLAPFAEIGQVARAAGVPFHTDAVQWIGSLPMDVGTAPIDLLSLSAHKFGGPKGVGALYLRRGTACRPLLFGGGQERGRRAGTENVAGIVGMAAALEAAVAEIPTEAPRLSALRDRLFRGLQAAIQGVRLNGHPSARLPGNINVAIEAAGALPNVESEVLLLALDLEEIAASAGAACTAGSLEPSHVIAALGAPPERVRSSIRFSLGRGTTLDDVETVIERLSEIVARLRR
jgi:cysteine desulfurase